MTKPVFTQSSIKKYLTCPRSYYYRYILGIKSRYTSNALLLGSAVHAALDFVNKLIKYGITPTQDAIKIYMSDYMQALPKTESLSHDDLGYIEAHLIAILNAWIDHNKDSYFDDCIVDSESGFIVPMRTKGGFSWTLCGVADVIIRRNGILGVRDYKTAAGFDNGLSAYTFGKQTNLYTFGISEFLSEDVAFFEYETIKKRKMTRKVAESDEEFQKRYIVACQKNASGKTTITQLTGETQSEYVERLEAAYKGDETFRRTILTRDSELVRESVSEANQIVEQILTLDANDPLQFVKSESSCGLYNRLCEYSDLCNCGCENLDVRINAYLETGRIVKKTIHAELGNLISGDESPF